MPAVLFREGLPEDIHELVRLVELVDQNGIREEHAPRAVRVAQVTQAARRLARVARKLPVSAGLLDAVDLLRQVGWVRIRLIAKRHGREA